MSYKSIFTVIHDAERDASVVAAAAAIAEAEGAHLTAICLGIDRTNPGAYYAGASAVALQESIAEAEGAARAAEKAVRAALDVWTIPWEATALTSQIGALAPVIGERAQLADLIVLPKPYAENRSVEDVVITESALFRTRVPVLVLPEGFDGAPKAERIVIAWNESIEALTAIRAAMPYLQRAESVDIAIIDPPTHAADRSDPGGALAEMLARHGVRADVSVLARTMPRISDVLCRHCEDKSADMLVMGAYGHSRFREAILGGATRNMLEMAAIPVLMAH